MTLVIIILKIEKENWMVLNLENVNCVTLQDEELMMVNGGLAPIVIGGVVVGWKVIGGVAGVIAARRQTMFKELVKYLPELIILLISLLYNIARMMSDLGYIKVPSWMLSIDVPNIAMLLILIILILKMLGEKDV